MSVTPLSVSDSSLKVMNAALAQLGVDEITSFTENTMPAKIGNKIFEDVLEDALASYPWRFARDRTQLQRSSTAAPSPWTGLYVLPTNAINLHTVYVDDYIGPFDRFGQNVAVMVDSTSASLVYAEVTEIVGADKWTGYFRRAFIMHLAAALAMPITQDEQTAAYLAQTAETMMLKARSRDAQGRSPNRLDAKLFIKARRTNRAL